MRMHRTPEKQNRLQSVPLTPKDWYLFVHMMSSYLYIDPGKKVAFWNLKPYIGVVFV